MLKHQVTMRNRDYPFNDTLRALNLAPGGSFETDCKINCLAFASPGSPYSLGGDRYRVIYGRLGGILQSYWRNRRTLYF